MVLSLLFGLTLDIVLMLLDPATANLASLFQKGIRALFICTGLTLASVFFERRAEIIGLGGLFAAPLGVYGARFVNDALARVLDLPDVDMSGLSFASVAALKGIEYGVLGILLARLQRDGVPSAVLYAAAGFAVGLLFGAITFALGRDSLNTDTLLAAWAINELVLPVGCAVIVAFAEGRASAAPHSITPPRTGRTD